MNIGEPKRSKISSLPWVTPDFIREHVLALRDGDKVGLAILRIESNENPPKQVVSASARYAQDELDQANAADDDGDENEFGCYYLVKIGENKFGADIHKLCRAETRAGSRYCSEHGGL